MNEAIGKKQIEELIRAALDAREKAYVPYSHYAVGAALLGRDGKIYPGVNVENASYGATNCAERTAFFGAVGEGARDFAAIAIAGGMEGKAPSDYAYPCGVCRQVMREFCGDDFQIVVAKNESEYKVFYLKELLPNSFGGGSIC